MKARSLKSAGAFYLQSRRRRGFALESQGALLHNFVPHAQQLHHRGPLTTQWALDWAPPPLPTHSRQRARRLAALRAFLRYVAQQTPEALAHTSPILAIPLKRYDRRLVPPLSQPEVQAVWEAPHPATPSGRREHLLFHRLYHTGARSSEGLALRPQDLRWGPPTVLRLQGKGRKERTLPGLKPLASELRHYLAGAPQQPDAWIFHNRFGQPRRRWGVVKRLRQTVQRAAQQCPTLKNRAVSPHTFRHTTALRLLQADVDILSIAALLGHESPGTTHHYIELDLHMKERGRRKLQSPKTKAPRFKPADGLLKWLEEL